MLGLLSAQTIGWITALVSILLLPRYLGEYNLGVLYAAWVVADLVTTAAAFGGDNYIVKNGARNPEATTMLVLASLVVRMTLGTALFLSVIVGIWLGTGDGYQTLIYIAVGSAALLGLATRAHAAGLQANHRLGELSIRLAAVGLIGQAVVIVGVVEGGRAQWIANTSVVTSLLSTAFAARYFWTKIRGQAFVTWEATRELFRSSAAFASWDVAILAFRSCDLLMLSVIIGSAAAGSYGLSYRIIAITGFMYTILGAALYPALASTAQSDIKWFREAVYNSTRLILAVSLPICIVLLTQSNYIISLLGGGEFEDSILVLVVLAMNIPFVALSTTLGTGIWSIDLQNQWAKIAWAGVACNVALNLVTIRLFETLWGNAALGAAASTFVTQAFMAAGALVLIRREVPLRPVMGSAWKCVAAGGIMSVVAIALPLYPLITSAIAAAVYAGVAFVLGLVQMNDLRVILPRRMLRVVRTRA